MTLNPDGWYNSSPLIRNLITLDRQLAVLESNPIPQYINIPAGWFTGEPLIDRLVSLQARMNDIDSVGVSSRRTIENAVYRGGPELSNFVAGVTGRMTAWLNRGVDLTNITWMGFIARNADVRSAQWKNVACSADGKYVIGVSYDDAGFAVYSADYGVTWLTASASDNPDLFGQFSSCCMSSDGKMVYLVSFRGGTNSLVWRSSDFGATYVMIATLTDGDDAVRDIRCSAGGNKLASYFESTASVLLSEDSGVTWSTVTSTAPNIEAIAISSNANAILVGSSAGKPAYSLDYGATWTSIASVPDDNWISAAVSADGKRMYLAQDGGDIWASPDSGTTWTNMTTGGDFSGWSWGDSSNSSLPCTADGKDIIGIADQGTVVSTDYGATWNYLAGVGNQDFSVDGNPYSGAALSSTANRLYLCNASSTAYGILTGTAGVYAPKAVHTNGFAGLTAIGRDFGFNDNAAIMGSFWVKSSDYTDGLLIIFSAPSDATPYLKLAISSNVILDVNGGAFEFTEISSSDGDYALPVDIWQHVLFMMVGLNDPSGSRQAAILINGIPAPGLQVTTDTGSDGFDLSTVSEVVVLTSDGGAPLDIADLFIWKSTNYSGGFPAYAPSTFIDAVSGNPISPGVALWAMSIEAPLYMLSASFGADAVTAFETNLGQSGALTVTVTEDGEFTIADSVPTLGPYIAAGVHLPGTLWFENDSVAGMSDANYMSGSVWIRAANYGSGVYLPMYDPSGSAQSYVKVSPTQIDLMLSDGTNVYHVHAVVTLSTNAWHHILYSVDGSVPSGSRTAALYVDDVEQTLIVNTDSGSGAIAADLARMQAFSGGVAVDVADAWFAPGESIGENTIDVPTRRMFITADLKPFRFFANSSGYTSGAQFSGDIDFFAFNRTAGGQFEVLGAGDISNTDGPGD